MLRFDSFLGKLKVTKIPEKLKKCFSVEELFKALETSVQIEIPGFDNLQFRYKGRNAPSSQFNNILWDVVDATGQYCETRQYINGQWVPIYPKGTVVWKTGNYASDQAGLNAQGLFLADGRTAGIPDLTHLFSGGDPNYTVYAVGFAGPILPNF